uniref:Tumor necrosis factor (ligand) superfamily, member 10 n=1 Tax=Nannospalax galili TaxID=1026970 RepID=A0A8C6RLJ9_NANGA
MASMQTQKGLSSQENFRTMVICTVFLQVLLQSVSMAVTYVYFTNEMKQLQDKYSKSGLACFLKEDEDSWDATDGEVLNSPCWQAKRQLRQLVREATLKTFEEMIPTVQEKHRSIPSLDGGGRHQRVAAHITGISRRSSAAITPISSDGKALGQKIQSWESSRKGHSFLNRLHLRNGELVIQERGLYYIYSQTYFRFEEAEEASKTASKESVVLKTKNRLQKIAFILS